MAAAADRLKTYQAKRDFAKTAEPSGKAAGRRKAKALSFVVQKHDATRLHYDFRLELDGVLMSWAVTKGPSTNPAAKRLAVHVEDHPLDYGGFEGTIPKGQYGGATVMLWDEGTWEPIGDPHEGMKKGDLKFVLHGKRMKGEWVLVHMKGRDQKTRTGSRENWLLIKHNDDYATRSDGLTEEFTTSVETGRDLEGIAKGNKPKRKPSAGLEVPSANVWTKSGAVSLPDFREPELATLVDEIPSGKDWLFEMKYDGYRALAAIAGAEVRIYTRNGNDWTEQFRSMVEPLSKVTKASALLDGEIVAFKGGKTDFSTLKDALSSGAPLTYFVFDLLEENGEDLRKLPLVERKERLRKLLGKTSAKSAVQFSEHIEGQGEKFFKAMCDGGYEGMVAKLGRSHYIGERTREWLKVKCIQRQEFVIGGWRPSEKKSTFASLLLGTWDNGKLIYRGRVGTGFNARSSAELQRAMDERTRKTSPFADAPRDISRRARWIEPTLVGEVAFSEVTPDGYLRHPSFMGLRQDKNAREVRLEKPATPPAAAPAKPKPRTKAKTLARVELTDEMGIEAADRLGIRLTHPDKVVYEPGITKAQLVAYYDAVAGRMLPHIAKRPLSLVRLPTGSKKPFFQKHDSGGFPDAFMKVQITETTGPTDIYLYIDDEAGLAASVQMNALELHIWGSHIDKLEQPDRIIFDIDPDEGLDFGATRQAAADIRDKLAELGLKTYPMVTGGKGIHVIAPLKPNLEWPDVKAFCHAFAEKLATDEPDRFTANIRKVNRKGRMFVDYLRNERGATAVCPFSTRAKTGATCAVPLGWDELDGIAGANIFGPAEAAARAQAPDPWPDYFKVKQTITRTMMKTVGAGT
jgi:bifunctional non-homologous end joining protein LigD